MSLAALEAVAKLALPAKGQGRSRGRGRKAGEEFQQFVHERWRLPDPKAKRKAGKDKERQDVLKALFGDNGVFTLTEAETIGQARRGQQKRRWSRLQAELGEAEKGTAAGAADEPTASPRQTVADMKIFLRGNPATLGEVAPRRFLRVLCRHRSAALHQGQRPARTGRGHRQQGQPADGPRLRQSRLVVAFRPRPRRHAEQLRATRRTADAPGAARLPRRPLRRIGLVGQVAAPRNHAVGGLSAVVRTSRTRDTATDPDNRLLVRSEPAPARRRIVARCAAGRVRASSIAPSADRRSTSNSKENRRRTVYCKVSRHDLNGLLRLFDFPDANITSERRTETTVPQQQLFVLNSPFFVGQAKALAARSEGSDRRQARIQRAYLLTYGRPRPSEEVGLALCVISARKTTGRGKPESTDALGALRSGAAGGE